ncbi:hypothetical protein PVAP13_3KG417100 [Panicum virgatum]|uniref:Uncharacterized protein n=1 Tax=Panicum virgatum TaxID=38727 RepID=A0A8T0V329_PANVG|nr:hypothetical protein PVAP13_3KG417100 [Panicum virgatum]
MSLPRLLLSSMRLSHARRHDAAVRRCPSPDGRRPVLCSPRRPRRCPRTSCSGIGGGQSGDAHRGGEEGATGERWWGLAGSDDGEHGWRYPSPAVAKGERRVLARGAGSGGHGAVDGGGGSHVAWGEAADLHGPWRGRQEVEEKG